MMEIDIEGFLTSHSVLPLTGNDWNTFEIEHFADAQVADTHAAIDNIRASIPRNTGGVYVYHDASGECIYVGKSADVRDRFRTHYRRSNREDRKGDRNNRHFNFWSSHTGKLNVSWLKIDREEDRQIIEIMLSFYLRPKFCEVPRFRV